jgi:hypothetical protein
MAEYVLTGSRSWDTTYAAQNGDGTGTFWANSFLPFFNRMTTLAYYLVEGGAVPASGASLNTQTGAGGASLVGFAGYTSGGTTFAAGTLKTTLEALIEYVETLWRFPTMTALGNTSSNVDLSLRRTFTIPVFAGASVTYTLPVTTGTPPVNGTRVRIISRGLNDTVDGVFIDSEGVGNVFKFTEGDAYGYVDMQFESTADSGNGAWVVAGWTVDNDAYALIDPYP